MTMTRKHYVALAKALRDTRPEADAPYRDVSAEAHAHYDGRNAQWVVTAFAVLDAVADFNPNFDRLKFLEAMGAGYSDATN